MASVAWTIARVDRPAALIDHVPAIVSRFETLSLLLEHPTNRDCYRRAFRVGFGASKTFDGPRKISMWCPDTPGTGADAKRCAAGSVADFEPSDKGCESVMA